MTVLNTEPQAELLFSDLTVESEQGQVALARRNPQPEGTSLPGLYVRCIRMEQAQATNAITVPQQAVTRTEQGDSVPRRFPRRPSQHTPRQSQHGQRQSLGDPRRPERWRTSDGGRIPKAADVATGHTRQSSAMDACRQPLLRLRNLQHLHGRRPNPALKPSK